MSCLLAYLIPHNTAVNPSAHHLYLAEDDHTLIV